MFGHDALPSRIYSYGAKPPVDGDLVAEQMRAAHRYRNRLVELEQNRRRLVDAALAECSPALAGVEVEIASAEKAVEAAGADLKREQARQRKKVRPANLVEPMRLARERLRTLRARRKEMRAALFASEGWRLRNDEIEAAAKSAAKELRATSGLYWGSYLHVEQSLSGMRTGAPPRFARWDGDGHLAVQLQGGLTVPDLFRGEDMRLRMAPVPPAAWQLGGRRLRKTVVSFRIGSSSGEPVWATIRIVLHRPLPEDASIKWAHLIRRRIATHCEWRVQFVVSRERGWEHEDRASAGVVGVDVGWRMRPDGSLRVAYWVGDDGAEGELTLEARWLSEMRRVEDIDSIRGGRFNDAKAGLAARLGAMADVPEWAREATATLASWKSAARLAAFSIRWRKERFANDGVAYEALEAWRKCDKHLLEYASNTRDELQRERANRYRVFAATMRRRYRTIGIERMDLSTFHEVPEADEPAEVWAIKEHVRDACLSALRAPLVESGGVVEVDAKFTTADCARCGHREQGRGATLLVRCSQCDELYDQDRNAGINILRAAGGKYREEAVTPGRSK